MAINKETNNRIEKLKDKLSKKIQFIGQKIDNKTPTTDKIIQDFNNELNYFFNKLLRAGNKDSKMWADRESYNLIYTNKGRKRQGITLPKRHLHYYLANTRSKILCGGDREDKTKQHYRFFSEAIEYTYFIQVKPKRDKHITGALNIGIDIDDDTYFTSFNKIKGYCKRTKQPEPTFITKTNRGWHILYTLDTMFKVNELLTYDFYKAVVKDISAMFKGDSKAAGFIMRNPLNHQFEFNNSIHSIIDFVSDDYIIDFFVSNFYKRIEKHQLHLIRLQNKTKKLTKQEVVYELAGVTSLIDLSKVEIGERNQALVSNLQTLGFRALRDKMNIDDFIEIARLENSHFPDPLTDAEVVAVANSTYDFCVRNYNYELEYKDLELFRQLAELIKSRKMKQIILDTNTLLLENYITLEQIIDPELFKNKWAKMINVDIKTLNKYLKDVQEFFILMVTLDKPDTDVGLDNYLYTQINILDLLNSYKQTNFNSVDDYNNFINKARINIINGNYTLENLQYLRENTDLLIVKDMDSKFWYANRVRFKKQNYKVA